MSTSFNKGPESVQPTTSPVVPHNKAAGWGPGGGAVKPDSYNGMAPAATVGGFADGAVTPSKTAGATARHGQGTQARATNATPTSAPPTPAPNGRDMGDRSNPIASSAMALNQTAHGSGTAARAESAAPSMARLARSGGKVGGPGVGAPTRHSPAALPAQSSGFPTTVGPQKSPLQAPVARGQVHGQL